VRLKPPAEDIHTLLAAAAAVAVGRLVEAVSGVVGLWRRAGGLGGGGADCGLEGWSMLVFAFCSACCSQGRGLCSGWVMSGWETFVWSGVGGEKEEDQTCFYAGESVGKEETCMMIGAHVKV